mmetsp:Transcript_101022/g.170860  ORF Transcript_101022/g.170860 Transcript_101022/m.170860 type:complete len:84 (-) Transcript_101022:377-628(-)
MLMHRTQNTLYPMHHLRVSKRTTDFASAMSMSMSMSRKPNLMSWAGAIMLSYYFVESDTGGILWTCIPNLPQTMDLLPMGWGD